MPIKIPDTLPATNILKEEGVHVMPESRAFTQDIRPLQIAIFNIMPTKIETETQLLRLLGASPLQVEVTFLHPGTHVSKNTHPEHLEKFYTTFEKVNDKRFDGLIITGAPVEKLEFDEITYWNELQDILNWSLANVYSTLHICWGAQAGLYHHYGVPKYPSEHVFGVFMHRTHDKKNPLLAGFDDQFLAPHARHTEVRESDITNVPALTLLADSEEAGVYLVSACNNRQVFVTGHSEYDAGTLDFEYRRDSEKGLNPKIPINYYPNDDPSQEPRVTWRSHANLFMTNWLADVYQKTPFDLGGLEPIRGK